MRRFAIITVNLRLKLVLKDLISGSVHENQCHFEYQKCLARKMYGVMLRPNGVCENITEIVPDILEQKDLPGEKLREVCDFECPIEADPLCDNRGVTHKNQC